MRISVSSVKLSRFGDEARADSADVVDTFWTDSCKAPPSTSEQNIAWGVFVLLPLWLGYTL